MNNGSQELRGTQVAQIFGAYTAGRVLLIAFGLLIILHLLVLTGAVSPDIIWGGQLNGSGANLLLLELLAILISMLFILVIAARLGLVKARLLHRSSKVGVWIIFGYLLLNTAGNLASGVAAENFFFAPITIILALFALRLAIAR